MTKGYRRLFCVIHSHLALWCSGYDPWLEISRLWVQIQEFLFDFLKEKSSLIRLILNTKSEKHNSLPENSPTPNLDKQCLKIFKRSFSYNKLDTSSLFLWLMGILSPTFCTLNPVLIRIQPWPRFSSILSINFLTTAGFIVCQYVYLLKSMFSFAVGASSL